MTLHVKYRRSKSSSFTQEDIFIQFSLMSLCKTRDPFCMVVVDPRTII